MAKQTINIGTSANDGTGSTLREAFDITNDNFTELYDGTGGLLHKIEGTNFTGSLLVGHSTTGTLSSAQYNTGIGIAALDALTSGDQNVAIGYQAATALQSSVGGVFIGYRAGLNITTGHSNIAIGNNALLTEDTHGYNIAIGSSALKDQNAGVDAYNVAIGHEAGQNVTTGIYNTILGGLAGDALTTGNSNIAIGLNALGGEDTGHDSVAIGRSALLSQNYDGSAYNVAIGRDAGRLVDAGVKNTIIGGLAGDNLTTGSNNILIGYDATASAVDVSNEVTIGDSNITNVRIPSDSTLKIGASGDLQLEHLSSNSFIKNTAVGDLYIENQVDNKDVIFRSDDGSGGLATYLFLDGSKAGQGGGRLFTKFPDNSTLSFGTDLGDLQIYHDGTTSNIVNNTGNLSIINNTDDGDIKFFSDDGSGGVTEYFRVDGGDEEVIFSKPIQLLDSQSLLIGNTNDLQIVHNGTDTQLNNFTGNFDFRQQLDNGSMRFVSDDGSGGLAVYFSVDGSEEQVRFFKPTEHGDNVKANFGTGSDLQIYHDGSDSYLKQQGGGDLIIEQTTDDKDIKFKCDDGSGGIATYLTIDGGLTQTTVQKNMKFEDNVSAFFGNGTDLRIFHNEFNSFITHSGTGDLYIANTTADEDIIFQSDDGSGGVATYFFLDGSAARTTFNKNARFIDDAILQLGTSGDLEIEHTGIDSVIRNYTGDLFITNEANDRDIVFRTDDGTGGFTPYITLDGSQGFTTAQKTIRFDDGAAAQFGGAADLRINHNGTDSFITNHVGDLKIIQHTDDGDILFQSDDGSGSTTDYFVVDGGLVANIFYKRIKLIDNVQLQIGSNPDLVLFHDASNSYIQASGAGDLIIEQRNDDQDIVFNCDDGSGGITEYLRLDGSAGYTVVSKAINFTDNVKALFGASHDLEIYHDGSNSYISDTGSGNLFIRSSANTQIESANGENMAIFKEDGAVELYYDNSKKIETTSSGVKLPQAGEGITLVSPDGNTTRTLTIDNSGNLVVGT